MVKEYKNTRSVVLLGNENNYGLLGRRRTENIPVEDRESTIRANAFMYKLLIMLCQK
jgi:hypothetical protein